ncbi:MAG TPA: CoA-binding protein [Desulfuromonadales bacterium]|nr:CoA-binding protein [Desulfuromonadales bacterium]
MGGVTFGDILFIVFICGVIYVIMSLVHRSQRDNDDQKDQHAVAVNDDVSLRAILEETASIAIVGASNNPERPSHQVMAYLQNAGYKIYPVTPSAGIIHGQQTYATLADLPEPPDVVEVFRRSDAVPDIARAAVACKAKVLWLQEGVISDEGLKIAGAGGLKVVMDRCMEKEYRRLVKEQ